MALNISLRSLDRVSCHLLRLLSQISADIELVKGEYRGTKAQMFEMNTEMKIQCYRGIKLCSRYIILAMQVAKVQYWELVPYLSAGGNTAKDLHRYLQLKRNRGNFKKRNMEIIF